MQNDNHPKGSCISDMYSPHDRIIVTELIKREWVVTDGYGMEGYVVLVVKIKE